MARHGVMNEGMTIGELGKRTGCNVETIRYYERIGILPEPARTQAGYRIYASGHVDRLAFVRRARELGFPLGAVRQMLDLSRHGDAESCSDIDAMVRERLADVDRKIADLKRLRDELGRLEGRCGGGTIGDCRILEALSSGPPAGGPAPSLRRARGRP